MGDSVENKTSTLENQIQNHVNVRLAVGMVTDFVSSIYNLKAVL